MNLVYFSKVELVINWNVFIVILVLKMAMIWGVCVSPSKYYIFELSYDYLTTEKV